MTLVRILEQSRDGAGIWSSDDAREATRTARDLVGTKARFAQFAARRASWVLDELARRVPDEAIVLKQAAWRWWAGFGLAMLALCAGFMTDYLAAGRLVNVVEPALVLLILWNLLIFGCAFLAWVAGLARRKARVGPLAAWMSGLLLSRSARFGVGKGRKLGSDFQREWRLLAAPLNMVRIKLVMHLAAMSFAIGAMVSFGVRGLFKEYKAGWETTFAFVDGNLLHGIVSWVLWPGYRLTGLPIPDAAHIQTLRLPQGTGEVASNWIVLYGASVLAWVILPRLLLAGWNAAALWRGRRDFPLPLGGAYLANLRAAWKGRALGVAAIPFRYELSAGLKAQFGGLLERVYGSSVAVTIEPAVLMGEDAGDWKTAFDRAGHVAVFVIFNLAATAEADAHGALMRRLRNGIGRGTPIVPVVDVGAYPSGDLERLRQRCNQWRQILDKVGFKPLFLNLLKSEDADLKALDLSLNHAQ
jgi:hypothetical protein